MTAGSAVGATTAGCGGRRDAENSGRVTVAVRADNGTDHSGFPFGNALVDVKIAERISLEPFLRRLVACDLRQSADAVALEAAMQG
ncbi:hypothetical protein MTX26_23740 [Bradyrhizobium sp. ISRA443]|uniref:hypothetical protein n=1 Tax=unclassified Bradyrhizobium TaxID=2631580 RepID=UPI002479D7A1|nr:MULTISPECIES: hypothetical protein [unclassified Bradyrhizobium]WGS09831.1 hypothetical protein MTX18_23735 [Bradyrhizobium sp. ISRA437]WGS16717.1 hypothetical protein MTX26_23740 [Bradyrhizobium sp. ISRA443]